MMQETHYRDKVVTTQEVVEEPVVKQEKYIVQASGRQGRGARRAAPSDGRGAAGCLGRRGAEGGKQVREAGVRPQWPRQGPCGGAKWQQAPGSR
jgi:hypothetical protein